MSASRPPPKAPHPELTRRPRGPFGWLDVRLLTEHYLRDLGPDSIAALVFLALTADRRGASWWARSKMAASIALSVRQLDRALHRLLELELVAHRPWKRGHRDGVWQILPMESTESTRGSRTTSSPESIRDILAKVREQTPGTSRSPPKSRGF